MKPKILFIIFIMLFFSKCKQSINDVDIFENYKVEIISPIENSSFKKNEKVLFHAILTEESNSINYDSIEWKTNLGDKLFNYDSLSKNISQGNHLITCNIFIGNRKFTNQVNITVQKYALVDTLYSDSNIDYFSISDRIEVIEIENKNRIYIGSENQGIIIKDNNDWLNYTKNDGMLFNDIQAIYFYKDILYVGHYFNEGISYLQNDKWDSFFVTYDDYEDVHYINSDNNGNLWVATHNGRIFNNTNNNWNEQLEVPTAYHHPKEIIFDSFNNLWGASDYGTIKFNRNNWESVKFKNNVMRSYSLVIDKNDVVWFGCNNGLYKITQNDTIVYNYVNSSFGLSDAFSLAIDNDNKLIVGTREGIAKFDEHNVEIINLPLGGFFPTDIEVDSKNNIWFAGTEYFGVIKN